MHYLRRAFFVHFTVTDAYVFVLLITLSSIIVCIFYFSFCFINFLYLFAKGTPRHNKRLINQSTCLSLSLSLSRSLVSYRLSAYAPSIRRANDTGSKLQYGSTLLVHRQFQS